MPKFSFVIPCYRSEKTITTVVAEIKSEMAAKRPGDTYEIVLVNDCSPDGVWNVIEKMASTEDNVIGVNLAKNFGQHSALMAGYGKCSGEYVVSLDDDGQAPLDSLNDLILKIEEGYDVVYAYYHEIKQNIFRRFGSWMAGLMGKIMLDPPKDMKGSSFYVARGFVIREMCKYKNAFPYLMGLVLRTTRKIAWVETQHRSRLEGTSGYSFWRLLSLWLNGFTAFSVKPLEFSTFLGMFFAVVGFIYAIVIVVQRIIGDITVAGWSSIIALMLIIGGSILMMLGLIGEYIGRIYICINDSPQYVIKEIAGRSLPKEDCSK
ncbi:glycosyltransferase family 2 protein [Fibrobacter succinogenes]|uniref:glycosyltransferase family 2 protein n=1 Tax=Fibrobacter succinogenes TaxID=833 RepID=UPI0015692B57|nr:glycosyltransferase family 2 protein [Fibrobacter succinogenes]